MKQLTYQKLQDSFQNGFKDVHQGTNWSYAVPWHDGRLVGCYEGYYLTGVTAKENRLLEPIEYLILRSPNKRLLQYIVSQICLRQRSELLMQHLAR